MATTKNNDSDFSSRLRSLRGDRTQGEFANFLGISSQQTYQNYERGRVPKHAVLQQISQRTGVSMVWLLTGETPYESSNVSSSVREEPPPYGKPTDFYEAFHKLASTADLPWLLDRMEALAADAAKGDRTASDTLAKVIPILRERLKT